ncbi:LruC domain-containing protein [Flagellimonas myxillae]|uniref:LruC domain-containing protein n=1 Tax=Flagellimonas myxillae TaxID=2942214 RepID=UPI00201EA2F7|nr:LruC domain-containing protein [Muricauda myxillae]MCL6265136.1 LruC domain-containing protein [Muricauda myxillae]
MKKLKFQYITLILLVGLLNQSCLKQKYDKYLESLARDSTLVEDPVLTELKFPENFDFKTEQVVSINISDNTPNVVYEVYPLSDDLTENLDSVSGPLPQKLLEREPYNGSILESVAVPSYVDELFLVRKSNSSVDDIAIRIIQNSVSYSFNGIIGKHGKNSSPLSQSKINTDCSNVYGQKFYVQLGNTIDTNGAGLHTLSNIQFPKNNVTAIITATDFNGAEFKNRFSLAGGWFSTPIFTFNGFIFWINSKIDTNNDPDGYVEFEMDFEAPIQHVLMHVRSVDVSRYQFVGNQHTETLLSGGSELTYDENERILRDLNPGSRARYYRDGYGTILISATSGSFDKIVWRRIDEPGSNIQNDSNWFTFSEVELCNDQDGDGAVDSVDEFPNDATRAFTLTYPSASTRASLVFEDLWPFRGDWDFNDTSIDYSITKFFNASNEVVAIDIDYMVTSDGAGFVNSLAFEIKGLNPNNVASISGQLLERSVFSLDSNGTELGQSHSVIPLFDDHSIIVNQENKVSIVLIDPITESILDPTPFNPFLVANGERDKEIHLSNHEPTSLGDNQPNVEGNNADVDGNYATENGLPWAINVVESFPLLLEKEPINEGYLFFEEWAISGGQNRKDWHKNIPGYRNQSKLKGN